MRSKGSILQILMRVINFVLEAVDGTTHVYKVKFRGMIRMHKVLRLEKYHPVT